jgi:predicted Na+-dependent transporter
MYAPGLGFLMFAVGVNLRLEAFRQVFRRPQARLCGSALSSAARCLLARRGD